MPRSRSIARFIVLLLLLAGAVAVALLASIDPNSYREQIESALGDLMDRPVSFGRIGYSLQEGFAIDCRDLDIPASPDSPFSLTAEHLYLKLDLLPLLRGELGLRQLILDHPRLHIDLNHPPAQKLMQTRAEPPSLTARLREVHLHHGEVSLVLPGDQPGTRPLRFTGLDLRILERAGERLEIDLLGSTDIEGESSELTLEAGIDAPWLKAWENNHLELEMTLRRLPLAAVAGRLGLKEPLLSGRAFLSTRLEGTAKDGLSLTSVLTAAQASLRIGDAAPAPVGQWRLGGKLRSTEEGWDLTGAALEHGDITLRAEATWTGREVAGELQLPATDTDRLLRQLPGGMFPPTGGKPSGGNLTASFALPPTGVGELATVKGLERISGTLELTGVRWQAPGLGPIESLHGELELRNGRIFSKGLQGRWQGRTQRISGTLQIIPELEGELAAELQVPALPVLDLLPEQRRGKFPVRGETSLTGTVTGNLRQAKIEVEADLGDIGLDIDGWFAKPRGEPGRLKVTLVRSGSEWQLRQGRLDLDENSAALNGRWQGSKDWELHLQGNGLNLEDLLKSSRHLAPHRLTGQVDLDLKLEDSDTAPLAIRGRVQLHDAGAHLTTAIADLQRVNGTLVLSGWGFKSLLLNARLGQSPVTLQTHMVDFSHPELKIHIQGKTLVAHELIFPSDQSLLRDLDGRLTIAAHGIDFNRVLVKLDGGTDCTVTGAMQGWHHPHVALDIQAPYADIDEVIALWHHPNPKKPKHQGTSDGETKAAPRRGPTVAITAHVAHGKLSRLLFERAEGTISSDGRGLLSIAPLQFHAGDGFGNGQVIVQSAPDRPSRLKISGHVENFAAQAIHRDLLQHDSILTGTLRGDFYLEGLTGKDFVPTSQGGINIEIHDGVLKKFQVLSKLFSLLNVSQIFSLQLPDMAEDGMPFEKIDASLSLTQGLLHTEDLLVHSEAMDLSIVGDYDLTNNRMDAILGVKPLKTVDRIITKIPIAGWILTGKEKALVTAHFSLTGDAEHPEVLPIPVTSLSDKVFGIFKRVLTLPGKVITAPEEVILPQSVNPKE